MSLKPVTTKWQTLVAICKECDGKPKRLRSRLKDELEDAHRHDVRVVMTSCQDICAKDGITVTIASAAGVSTYVSSGDAEEIVQAIGGESAAPKATAEIDPPDEGESIVQRAF